MSLKYYLLSSCEYSLIPAFLLNKLKHIKCDSVGEGLF